MKKFVASITLALAFLLLCLPSFAATIKIEVDGKPVKTPPEVHIYRGQVMVPLNWVIEQAGAQADKWDGKSQTINIKTGKTYFEFHKYISYVGGVQFGSDDRNKEICPLPLKANNLKLPSFSQLNPNPNLNFYDNNPLPGSMTINVNGMGFALYTREIINGKLYVLSDWIQELSGSRVKFDTETNILSVSKINAKDIEKKIAVIVTALIPANPLEAVNLWLRGNNTVAVLSNMQLFHLAYAKKLSNVLMNLVEFGSPVCLALGWVKQRLKNKGGLVQIKFNLQ